MSYLSTFIFAKFSNDKSLKKSIIANLFSIQSFSTNHSKLKINKKNCDGPIKPFQINILIP